MKKLVYLALSAILALGSAACGGNNNNKEEVKKKDKTTDSTKPTEKDTPTQTTKVKEGVVCTPSVNNPCEDGLACIEIPFEGISRCFKECTKDADCADGKVCGVKETALHKDFIGKCIEALPAYSFCMYGYAGACPENSICTDGGLTDLAYLAYQFYSDVTDRKNDVVPNFGLCTPICSPDGQNTCPKVNLGTEKTNMLFNYDFLELNGRQPKCIDITDVVNAGGKIGICGFTAIDDDYCNEANLNCVLGTNRKYLYADDNLQNDKIIEVEGRALCNFSPLAFDAPAGVKDTKDGELVKGYDEYDRLIGECMVLCTEHQTCACSGTDADDPSCAAVQEGMFRDCKYMHLASAPADNIDDDLFGFCSFFVECNDDSDCAKYGSGVKCNDPTQPITYNGKQYTMPQGFSKKFCFKF